ncbi:MAG: glycosyltransferase family 32 protein [Candidatus Nealsonbacteria bacterium]
MIQKFLHHIWVGPLKRPKKWMDTWPAKHPDWNYILWDNRKVFNKSWINQKQIDFYKSRREWPGIADIIRYEILYEYGGIMPGADWECLNPIDELLDDCELFAVSCCGDKNMWKRVDGKKDTKLPIFLSRGKTEFENLITPIIGGTKGHWFFGRLNEEIGKIVNFGPPWRTTGNMFCQRMVKTYKPQIKVFPMHYFIPDHPRTATSHSHYKYIGKDKIYARHHWGTTRHAYKEGI